MSPHYPMISTRGWSLETLLQISPKFHSVARIPASISALSEVLDDYDRKGEPLVIEGFQDHSRWPKDMFSLENFVRHSLSKDINARNVHTWTDRSISLDTFIHKSRSNGPFAEEGETERLYGKDAPCPAAWEEWLNTSGVVPPSVLSLGPDDEFSHRPESSPVETLMCYLGVGDTFTPCHKDLCASSGQNLMVYTEGGGSSFWFMTKSSSAPKVSSYFQRLGRELDQENFVITVAELAKAPFDVYILEQKLGDLVLVPPRSCHQVVNFGGITVKTSWSRMTLSRLSTAFYHELPIYRRVCRPETYRIKSTVFYALESRAKRLAQLLCHEEKRKPRESVSFQTGLADAINRATGSSRSSEDTAIHSGGTRSLALELRDLISLYDAILCEEYPGSHARVNTLPDTDSGTFNDDSRIVCDCCECDIFQSFFECRKCLVGTSRGCVVCPGCYADGRTCSCSTMKAMQCRPFKVLLDARVQAINVLTRYEEIRGCISGYNLDWKQDDDNVPSLFRIAYVLFTQDKSKLERKCSTKGKLGYISYTIPYSWAVNCKLCHRARPFTELLETVKLHSAEALLQHSSDATHTAYHQCHLRSKLSYADIQEELKTSQAEGTPTNGYRLLAYIALHYAEPRPLHASSLKLGWYDQTATQALAASSNSSAPPIYPTPSRRRSGEPLIITVPALSPARPLKRTKSLMYVDVPSAPYPTTPKRRRLSIHEFPPPTIPRPFRAQSMQDDDTSSSFYKSTPSSSITLVEQVNATNEDAESTTSEWTPISNRTTAHRKRERSPSPDIAPVRALLVVRGNKGVRRQVKSSKEILATAKSPAKPPPTPPIDQSAKKAVLSKLRFKKNLPSPTKVNSEASQASSTDLSVPSTSGSSALDPSPVLDDQPTQNDFMPPNGPQLTQVAPPCVVDPNLAQLLGSMLRFAQPPDASTGPTWTDTDTNAAPPPPLPYAPRYPAYWPPPGSIYLPPNQPGMGAAPGVPCPHQPPLPTLVAPGIFYHPPYYAFAPESSNQVQHQANQPYDPPQS